MVQHALAGSMIEAEANLKFYTTSSLGPKSSVECANSISEK
jgi:hypothetical protein